MLTAISQANVEIVRSLYEAFAQHDCVTPYKYYAPDIEWDNSGGVELVGGSTVYHGRVRPGVTGLASHG